MKRIISKLLLILAICIIAMTSYFHPRPVKDYKKTFVKYKQPMTILHSGCAVDSNKNCKNKVLVSGHCLGILFLGLGSVLALMSLSERRSKHTDEEYEAKAEELKQLKIKLDEGNGLLEELKTAVEANKAGLEKLESENRAKLEAKEAELEKAKAETAVALSKAENFEKDNKGVKREVDRLNSQIKAVLSEKEELKTRIIELQKQIEAQTEELKAVSANAKGGKEAVAPAAYQILYLLQKEGRLIDLLNEDVSEIDDESLGGAVRPVLEGCAKLLKDRLIVEPVLNDEEGSEVTVDEADPESIKLSGNVPESGPYKGELVHHGWRLKECKLPELVDGWRGNVIAPAEIEID